MKSVGLDFTTTNSCDLILVWMVRNCINLVSFSTNIFESVKIWPSGGHHRSLIFAYFLGGGGCTIFLYPTFRRWMSCHE